MTPEDKIRLLQEAIRGPDDCFALRSHAPDRDPPWYWRPVYTKLTDDLVRRHLTGEIEIGSYALIPGATPREHPRCRWIAADFDGKRPGSDWENDVRQFLSFLVESGANILVNRSRSGLGVHVRVLFRDPVPAWMARRWMQAWVDESAIVDEIDDLKPTSFDRLIPMQDTLRMDLTDDGHRRPGNLVGAPMHRKLARSHGGTLPISLEAALRGDFDADGKHWEHLVQALERREWGETELLAALKDAPGDDDGSPPPPPDHYPNRALTVLQGDAASTELYITRRHCEFFVHLARGAEQPYAVWVALATQLHRFGEAGRELFHELSALDPRYKPRLVDQKWDQTADMHPNRCDTIAALGWRCPHLGTNRCRGAKAPAYFAEHQHYEPL